MWNIILDFDGRFWCTDELEAPLQARLLRVHLSTVLPHPD